MIMNFPYYPEIYLYILLEGDEVTIKCGLHDQITFKTSEVVALTRIDYNEYGDPFFCVGIVNPVSKMMMHVPVSFRRWQHKDVAYAWTEIAYACKLTASSDIQYPWVARTAFLPFAPKGCPEQHDAEKAPVEACQNTQEPSSMPVDSESTSEPYVMIRRRPEEFIIKMPPGGQKPLGKCFVCNAIGIFDNLRALGGVHKRDCIVGATLNSIERERRNKRKSLDEECWEWTRREYPQPLSKGEWAIARAAWRAAKGFK